MIAFLSALPAGCSKDRTYEVGTVTSEVKTATPVLGEGTKVPGLHVNVIRVGGNSAANVNSTTGTTIAAFREGNRLSVTFTLTQDDGSAVPLVDLDEYETMISGPTDNYQIVIPVAKDLVTKSVKNLDGSYTYTFPALPKNYSDPANYKKHFYVKDTVLGGTALRSGTYTWAILVAKHYKRGAETVKAVANQIGDFVYGNATTITHRDVVTQRNCNQCHEHLQRHGGLRQSVSACVLCHVAGAEDWSDPKDANSPKGETIEFKVLVHRLHNSSHLPSFQGVYVDASGARKYDGVPKPFTLMNENNVPVEYEIQSPNYQQQKYAMPRRLGYSAIPAFINSSNLTLFTTLDTNVRKGVQNCEKCHEKPQSDALGFAKDAATRAIDYPAPAQGDLAYKAPSQRVCWSCHDDLDFTKPYSTNGFTHQPAVEFKDDTQCITCHVKSTQYPYADIKGMHRHPMTLENVACTPPPVKGVNWKINGITPLWNTGAGDTAIPAVVNGLIPVADPLSGLNVAAAGSGAKIQVSISCKDDDGQDIFIPTALKAPPGAAATATIPIKTLIAGPTSNYQGVHYFAGLYPEFNAFAAISSSYTFNLPQVNMLEFVGDATNTAAVFSGNTRYSPHWQQYFGSGLGAPTKVIEVIPANIIALDSTTVVNLVSSAQESAVFLDVTHMTTSPTAIVKDDIICIDRGNKGAGTSPSGEEWFHVRFVEPNHAPGVDRLWLVTPYNGMLTITTATFSYSGTNGLTIANYGPWVRKPHLAGAQLFVVRHPAGKVLPIAPIKAEGTDYGLNQTNGRVTEVQGRFTAGAAILVSYTSDFVMPYYYPPAYYDADEITEVEGKWAGKPIVSGTYSLGVWAAHPWALTTANGEPQQASAGKYGDLIHGGGTRDFLGTFTKLGTANNGYVAVVTSQIPVGSIAMVRSPTAFEPYALISSPDNCKQCHGSIQFHGGDRLDHNACVLCHGTAGIMLGGGSNGGRWPTAANAQPYGQTVKFSNFLHKVHYGDRLTNTFINNGSFNSEEFKFPAMPNGVRSCDKCHGLKDSSREYQVWDVPRDRTHPIVQTQPMDRYTMVCGSCHDTKEAAAHFSLMSSTSGQESCHACHGGPGATYFTGTVHLNADMVDQREAKK